MSAQVESLPMSALELARRALGLSPDGSKPPRIDATRDGDMPRLARYKPPARDHRPAEPGRKYGRWTVVSFARFAPYGKSRVRMFLCRCECGLEKEVREGNLRNGYSQGCLKCAAKARRA